MKLEAKTKVWAIVLAAIAVVAVIFAAIGYQRGVVNHQKTLEDLEAKLREINAEVTSRQNDLANIQPLEVSTPFTDMLRILNEAGDAVALIQNSRTDFATLSPDVVAPYSGLGSDVTDSVWYADDYEGRSWQFYPIIDLNPTTLENKMIWLLRGSTDEDVAMVAVGYLDTSDSTIKITSIYSTSLDVFTQNNDPSAPDPSQEGSGDYF